MKKMIAIIPAAVLAIGAWTGTAAAQTGGKAGAHAANASEACSCFVDSNHDGICDNRGTELYPQNGTGNGHHRRNDCFVDANNDGICDNKDTCTQNGGRNRQNRNARFSGYSRGHRR
ncbi:MAG: hypothetical protein K2N31_05095 [Treponemataceae bacterium]|nr:hypothetical protein [Treponemataceae bacterium]